MRARATTLPAVPEAPWFQRRPRLTVLVVLALFAGVLALRLATGDSREAILMLFVLPIALMAFARGRTGGLLAGVLGVLLMVVWSVLSGTELSVLGWTSRVVPLLLVGGLLGDASDRLRRAEVARRELELTALRHRQAVEINDGLVQGMAAAKWSLDAGRTAAATEILDDTLARGHQLVSMLLRDADMGVGEHHESLPDREDREATRAVRDG